MYSLSKLCLPNLRSQPLKGLVHGFLGGFVGANRPHQPTAASTGHLRPQRAGSTGSEHEVVQLFARHSEVLAKRVVFICQLANLCPIASAKGLRSLVANRHVAGHQSFKPGLIGSLLGSDVANYFGRAHGDSSASVDNKSRRCKSLGLKYGRPVGALEFQDTSIGGSGVVDATGGSVVALLSGESGGVNLLLRNGFALSLSQSSGQRDTVGGGRSNATDACQVSSKRNFDASLGDIPAHML
mmetsp:Transcript_67802/g.146197  ORF Transcript_67802/g.146197 Transcript_67802/m.146197 type:complete len:241 (+) Transcript_67802:111-833(+)